MKISISDRLEALPPYLFAEIDRKKKEALRKGTDIIDLGVGDPDRPTPPHIIEALRESALDPKNHTYPSYSGMNEFRKAAAKWYAQRFGPRFNPEKEVVTLIGSKEGIAHLPLAFINKGDYALVPDPAYPVYQAGTVFAGGRCSFMPLRRENGFLPDLGSIPRKILERTKLLFINYPNNPTSARADIAFFKDAVRFAKKHGIIVAHDAAYSEVYLDGKSPASFLQADGARDVGIEFHSLSKTYNMTGWRIGFAIGHPGIVAGIGKVKTNIDSGVFQAVQWAAICALRADQTCTEEMRTLYRKRRDVLIAGLRMAGLDPVIPKATFYVWVPVPEGFNSMKFSSFLLEKAGIVVTPGVGFGKAGEGYVRMSLTIEEERLREASQRIVNTLETQ